MMPLAAVLALASWLWWSGLEVPARRGNAMILLAASVLALGVALARSGRRLPPARRTARAATWGLVCGGVCVLLALSAEPLVDWLAPFASWHALPAQPLAAAGGALGMEVMGASDRVIVQELSRIPAHGTSLEQLGFASCAVLLVILGIYAAPRQRGWLRFLAGAALTCGLWMPLRFLLVTRIVDDFDWLGAHWQPLAAALSWFPALWLASLWNPQRSLAPIPLAWSPRALVLGSSLAAGLTALAFGMQLQPAGERAQGRILMDGAHSDWEWTHIPFNQEIYGRQSTYNYYCLIDYLAHHYPVMDVNAEGELSDEVLSRYDVVILKTPTRAFLESERDAVTRFVRAGGGLLLISDHTNLFGMTTYLNPIGEPFGIEFNMDDTFDLTSGQPTRFARPKLGTHPIVAHMPPFEYETSCTLRPSWRMRPVMVGRGMGSEQVDYEHVNFFGNIIADPDERWGAFVQAGARGYGAGRVAAFTDSTVFSNFSVFYRGKPELALGLVEFLNRRTRASGRIAVAALIILGGALIAAGLFAGIARRGWARMRHPQRVILAALACAAGLLAGGALAGASNVRSHPLPEAEEAMVTVAFDRSHSNYRLPTLLEPNVPDPQSCFDSFFVTIQRLHLFPREAETLNDATRAATVVVVVNPVKSPSPEEADKLYAWVRQGGTLLVMEPQSGAHVAANRFLELSGMRIAAAFPDGRSGPARGGVTLTGGTPLAWPAATGAEGQAAPVIPASRVPMDKGQVVALIGSEEFSFQKMGAAFNDPTSTQRPAYERTYALFEQLLGLDGRRESCPLARKAAPATRAAASAGPAAGASR